MEVSTAEVMSNNRVSTINYVGVVSPLVEHSNIDTVDRSKKNHSFCGSLIRCNEHKMILVYNDILIFSKKTLSKLKRWRYILNSL